MRRHWLSDEEYDRAEDLARQFGKSLERCPTCDTRVNVEYVDPPEPPTYKYRGEVHPCDCNEQIALYARYLLANIGEQYQRLDWADYDGCSEARDFVATYLSKWKNYQKHGWGVEFGGPLGIGKTFAATHIGKELIKKGQKVYFIPFIEMKNAYEVNGHDLEGKMRMIPWLILDEIIPPSSERARIFFGDRLEGLIRHRTNFNLPTLITTNMTQEDLHECYPRTYSLLSAKQSRIEMSGSDARSGKIQMENMELIANEEVRPIT